MKRLALGVAVAFVLAGCAVNPVTGKRELRVIPESYEVSQGTSQYLPAQPAEGGEPTIDPALDAYVRGVGERLAAVRDRRYEWFMIHWTLALMIR